MVVRRTITTNRFLLGGGPAPQQQAPPPPAPHGRNRPWDTPSEGNSFPSPTCPTYYPNGHERIRSRPPNYRRSGFQYSVLFNSSYYWVTKCFHARGSTPLGNVQHTKLGELARWSHWLEFKAHFSIADGRDEAVALRLQWHIIVVTTKLFLFFIIYVISFFLLYTFFFVYIYFFFLTWIFYHLNRPPR